MTTDDNLATKRVPPPWLFGVTGIPFGVAGGYSGVAMPFLLRKVGVDMDPISALAAAVLIPSSWQFLWAWVVDVGPRRRNWLIFFATVGALCLTATLFLELPRQLTLFRVLLIAGQGLTGMTGSCNGGLVAVTLPLEMRGRAGSWMQATNLIGAALGGGVVLYLARVYSFHVAGIGLGLMVFLPSLAALFVPEAKRVARAAREVFVTMIRDVWGTAKSRQGWSGILICLAPVGAAALLNLMSGLAQDYHAPDQTVEFINGYWGGLVTAGGALLCGTFLDRVNKRAAYMCSGASTAIICVIMAQAPLTPLTYKIGALAYLFATGFCYASYAGLVLEIVSGTGHSASTQYTLYSAAANMAITYVTWLDGKGYKLFERLHLRPTSGMLYTDAATNVVGIAALALMLLILFPRRQASEETRAAA